MAATIRTEPIRSKESGVSFQVSRIGAGAQGLGQSSTFPGYKRTELEVEPLGLQPASICGASTAARALACTTTLLAPGHNFYTGLVDLRDGHISVYGVNVDNELFLSPNRRSG